MHGINAAFVSAKPDPVLLTRDAKTDASILARKDLAQASWICQVSTVLPECGVSLWKS